MAFNNGSFLQCKLPNDKILNIYIPLSKQTLTNGQSFNLANFKNRLIDLVGGKPLSVLGGFVRLDNNLGNINKIVNVIANNQYTFEYAWRNFVNLPQMFKQILGAYNDGGYAMIFNDYLKNDYNTSYQYLTCPILVDGIQSNYNIYIRYRWVRSNNPSGNDQGFYSDTYLPGTTYPQPATKPQYYYTPQIQYSFNNQSSWLGSDNGDIIVRDSSGDIYVLNPQTQEAILNNNFSYYTRLNNTVVYTPSGTNFILTSNNGCARFNLAYAYKRTSYFSTEIKNIINTDLEESTPYSANGENSPTTTSGSYDGTSESVTEDALPTDNVLSSDLLSAYLPGGTELTNLHSYLFSSSFVDNIIKALKCPFDAIIKLHSLPISVSGSADTIKLGNLDSGIACDRTTSRYIDVNLGNMFVEGYYGLFNDYSAKYDLYLPYLNVVSLPADEVINATISINYRVDILTGDFVCTVSSSKTNAKGSAYTAIIYSGGGNMASDIPITQSNSLGMIGALNSGLNTVMSKPMDIGGSFQTGVAIGVGGSVSYGAKGSLSSNSGKLGKRYPYLRETIPNVVLPADFSKLVGFRSEITDNISNFSGFCKFRDFELDFGTVDEQNEIRQILNGGIYVKGTPSIVTAHDIVLLNNSSDDRTLGKSVVTVDEIDGNFKDFVNLRNIDIDIDITGLSIGSINYMYIASLRRYYFVRQKTMLNDSICRFSLVCDLLESMATDILSVKAICDRAESGYYTNPMLADSEVPVQVNNIIKYHNFSAGLDDNTNVLIVI